MYRVAWLTCVLLALAHGRIYDRCELARDLQSFGVNPEDISTWVCIAYHESRFDTTANNPYSGDHGIFQISELYWCGPGKACGLPCSALRDDDISNDIECALKVQEEHTRLQGNGFLAWVVYPQHCKYNTKKYLVDCDNVKSAAPLTKSRAFGYEERYSPNVNYSIYRDDNSAPSYLAIANLFRGSYGKVLDYDKGKVDWYNYKFDNIDDLKLPDSFANRPIHLTEPSTTSTTTTTQTTTTMYIPPVKPWRTIETNQFRKKQLFHDKSTAKPATVIEKSSVTLDYNTQSSTPTTTFQTPSTQTTTPRPSTTTATQRPSTTWTTIYPPRITSTRTFFTTSAKPPSSSTIIKKPAMQRITTVRPTTRLAANTGTTTLRVQSTKTLTPLNFIAARQPIITSTAKVTTSVSTTEWPHAAKTRSWMAITKPSTTTVSRSTTRWTTAKPSTTLSTTVKSVQPSTTRRPYEAITHRPTTSKLKTSFTWPTFTSRTATTAATTKFQSTFPSTTSRPNSFSTTTSKQTITTHKPKSTQSIFDLYLNPTKPPELPKLTFDSAHNSKYKLKIFASGTTTPAPWKLTTTHKHNRDSVSAKNPLKNQNDTH